MIASPRDRIPAHCGMIELMTLIGQGSDVMHRISTMIPTLLSLLRTKVPQSLLR